MKNVGYYNGKIGLIEEMTVPMNDRGLFFGDGVYDATIAANKKMFKPYYHIDRFYNSMKAVQIDFDHDKEWLCAELQKCIDLCDSNGPLFVYWQVTRGTALRTFNFPDSKPNLMIYIFQAGLTDLKKPWKVITVEDTRFLHCDVKTLNLLPAVLASEKAKQNGCQEVIFHRGNRVTECAHNNVHIIKDGVFITPPLDNLILPGTARRHILELCQKNGIPYEERAFTLEELFDADEILISCAATYGVPVCQIDGKNVGGKDGATLRKIQELILQDFIEETGYNPKMFD